MPRIFLLAIALLVVASAAAQELPAVKRPLVVIAHRGNHVAVPENTVAAIAATIACDADYVELDLRTTLDGKLVLMHDATVDRTTDGKGRVADLTLAAIKDMKIRSTDGKEYRVPTFEEALQACKGKLNIYLDFKSADVTAAWEQLKAAGMEKRVVVYLNSREQYSTWRTIAPAVPLMTSLPAEIKTTEQLAIFLQQTQIRVLDNITDSAMIAVARQYHVMVWLDVQHPAEGPADWKEAMEKGVQGMQTDHPEALVRFLDRR